VNNRYCIADVTKQNDYSPFGMQMPGRKSNEEAYRYAFNGMETDKEVSGGGNSYTTQFRQYDPRLGRWKSLDPLAGKFPNMSPFNAFNNNPIIYIDKEGTDTLYFHSQIMESSNGKTILFKITFSVVQNGVETFIEPDLPEGTDGIWFAVPKEFWYGNNVWYPLGESIEFPIRYSYYEGMKEYPNSIRIKYITEKSSFRIMAHYMGNTGWSAGCNLPTCSPNSYTSNGDVKGVHTQEAINAMRALYDEYILSEKTKDKWGRDVVEPINGYEFLMKTQSTSRFEITKMKPREVTSVKVDLPKAELDINYRQMPIPQKGKAKRQAKKQKRRQARIKKKEKTSIPSI